MLTCINKNSSEYQLLKQRANISDFILESVCRDYLDKYNRFPYLDELPNSDSSKYLKDKLHLDNYNGTKSSTILEYTGENTLEDANIFLNNEFRDLETTVYPLEDEAIVDIVHRPTINNENSQNIEQDTEINSSLAITAPLTKLAKLYGIKFNLVTTDELNTENWSTIIPDANSVNAFVYNNQIYINTDKALADAPIHELLHIFLGSMRFSDPKMYFNLVNSATQFKNYNRLSQQYVNRTQSDVNEELFVSEIAKYLSGMRSEISNLDQKSLHEIMYNIRRTLDSVLMGQDSTGTISDQRLLNMPLKELAKKVNSDIFVNKFSGTFNVENSYLHRKLNNIKSDLIKEKTLKYECD